MSRRELKGNIFIFIGALFIKNKNKNMEIIALTIVLTFVITQIIFPLVWGHKFIFFWALRYNKWQEHKDTYEQAKEYVRRRKELLEKVEQLSKGDKVAIETRNGETIYV